MKLVYVNLHTYGMMMKTLVHMMTRRRTITKHRFLLQWLIEHNVKVVNYVTPDCDIFIGTTLNHFFQKECLRKRVAKFVLKKNGFSSDKIEVISEPAKIGEGDVVVYYETYYSAQEATIEEVKGIKVLDLIHFYGNKEKADLLKRAGFQYYMYEVDLKKYCKLFQKNYNWFHGEYIERPYSFEPRFKITREFDVRKNKAVAMGTLTVCKYPELAEEYGSEYYQPRRKMILDNAGKYPKEMDSYISEFQEVKLKPRDPKDGILKKYYKKLFNYIHNGKQKNYFSFDMVEKYNEYKMFICPEDVNGSYGVGTIEGMACGCAMIGWDYGAFEDMGMTAGVHYISYDGTMENLIEKIRYYQKPENQNELRQIAQNGYEFIRTNFSQEKVAERYYNNLKRIAEEAKGKGNASEESH